MVMKLNIVFLLFYTIGFGVFAGSMTIDNTAPRKDTDGNVIDAHDGRLICFEKTWYLYGTCYGKTDGFGKENTYRCYSSKDLMSWKYEGELLKNPPEGIYYRPHVIYNQTTRTYVLWYNWYPSLWNGQYGVAVSDKPTGPFTIINTNVNVKNRTDKSVIIDQKEIKGVGDLNLFVDDDGAAYLVYTTVVDHTVSVERLSADYLSSAQQGSEILMNNAEACAMFRYKNGYYVLTDTCCCFCPEGTGARVYRSEKPLGPYRQLGNINRAADDKVIIKAQQTHVAQIAAKDGIKYVWMGDLWHSAPDQVKGHDLQFWSEPLKFDADGNIAPLQWTDRWTLELIR